MYEDVEADFWKEIFVHLQHKNMMRSAPADEGEAEDSREDSGPKGLGDGQRFAFKLSVKNATEQFDIFSRRNPGISPIVEGSSSYFTWEVFVTSTIKVRLFIQNQIKCSLMQNISGDFTKIADAKFPNNPFPELEEFLSRCESYKCELSELKDKTIRNKKQMKIAGEFIKAYLGKKFNSTNTLWQLEEKNGDYILKIDGIEDKIISINNFVNEINSL